MNHKKSILIFVCLSPFLIGSYINYNSLPTENGKKLFSTQPVGRRTITQVVKATGKLDVQDMMKIGSIITGIILKMHAEENDYVKKGDLLADIKDGKEDTEVKQAQAQLEKAQAELTYIEKFYSRQKALYEQNHISTNTFEQAIRTLETAQAEVRFRQASREEAQLNLDNEKIIAPDDGLVIDKVASEGETVTLSSPPTILYTIAKDITKMKAQLEIEESYIHHVKKNMTALLRIATHPHCVFKGSIKKISNAPKNYNGTIAYTATVPIDNKKLLFRPGTTVEAEILIEEKEDVIAISSNCFTIDINTLEKIAHINNFECIPLNKKEKRKLLEQNNTKIIWTCDDKAFVEKPIKIGIHDNSFFEVVQGLNENEHIIINTVDSDIIKKISY